ncbi:MAG: flagellar hook-basal body complex protein FliE [Pseudomonadota bacterium]
MDVNAFNAARAYGAAKQTLRPEAEKKPQAEGSGDAEFKKAADFVKEMGAAVAEGEQKAADFMVGKADPHSVVEALASAELAVETAVTVRNRVVEAYQELMRMPV